MRGQSRVAAMASRDCALGLLWQHPPTMPRRCAQVAGIGCSIPPHSLVSPASRPSSRPSLCRRPSASPSPSRQSPSCARSRRGHKLCECPELFQHATHLHSAQHICPGGAAASRLLQGSGVRRGHPVGSEEAPEVEEGSRHVRAGPPALSPPLRALGDGRQRV